MVLFLVITGTPLLQMHPIAHYRNFPLRQAIREPQLCRFLVAHASHENATEFNLL